MTKKRRRRRKSVFSFRSEAVAQFSIVQVVAVKMDVIKVVIFVVEALKKLFMIYTRCIKFVLFFSLHY